MWGPFYCVQTYTSDYLSAIPHPSHSCFPCFVCFYLSIVDVEEILFFKRRMWKIELNLDVDDSDKLPVRKREWERTSNRSNNWLVGKQIERTPHPKENLGSLYHLVGQWLFLVITDKVHWLHTYSRKLWSSYNRSVIVVATISALQHISLVL